MFERLLFVGEKEALVRRALLEDDRHYSFCRTFEASLELLASGDFDVCVVDFQSFEDCPWSEVLAFSERCGRTAAVILFGALPEVILSQALASPVFDECLDTNNHEGAWLLPSIKQLLSITRRERQKASRSKSKIDLVKGRFFHVFDAAIQDKSFANGLKSVLNALNGRIGQNQKLPHEESLGAELDELQLAELMASSMERLDELTFHAAQIAEQGVRSNE